MNWLAIIAGLFLAQTPPREPTVIACKFERLPLMVMVLRGGMGADDNTLQIGQDAPVKLNVGSTLMTAERDAQEFTFSLRLPASVSVSAPGNDTQTYDGECVVAAQSEQPR
ncbi:hypothetical protein E4M02_04365 [Brevundimonas sp. S30B]|uniref:hypothetical protein n=1 Tax=unclassified Brevundimonas TaxID=2622653 RepID=UPI001071776D|nr:MULTISPECIES: hypothetical protein [unclassified Brevundimonas]QBX36895.1 hypothetical protein E4M01_03450 [Brevundimonas sp. MF30-B]TFW04310.1 hypothetical protein E4M02_04365 [Brevundimonas sp. S30B]